MLKINTDRKNYIDVMRGLGMILVVWAHIFQNSAIPINTYIYAFHMPLFFFITGLCTCIEDSWKDYVKKRIKSIVIPYFFWASVTFIYWILLESKMRTISGYTNIRGLFGIINGMYDYLQFNTVLWFLPTLFVSTLLLKLILGFRKELMIFLIIVCVVVGVLLYDLEMFWGINRAFRYTVYALGGYYFKVPLESYAERKKEVMVVSLIGESILVGMISVGLENHITLYFIAFAGITGIVGLAIYLRRVAFLQYIGQNTMVLLVLQGPVYRALLGIIQKVGGISQTIVRSNFFFTTLMTSVVISLLLFVNILLRKIIPWAIGQKRKGK